MVQNGRHVQPDSAQPLTGKVMLVTGASDGIGKVTALELARQGATVVGVGRNPAKCAAVERELRAASANPSFEMIVADLSTQAGVCDAADRFRQGHRRLDVLVNNAGALFWNRELSADGVEMTWALNHLGYFRLTHHLLDVLKASAPSRVVVVSSDAHRQGSMRFDDVEFAQGYNPWRAYSQSKLANVLFANELARRLDGTGVTANSLHPGFVASRFGHGTSPLFGGIMGVIQKVAAISAEEGARTSVYLAASPEVQGVSGRYFAKSREVKPASAALDAESAQRLWRLSEQSLALAAGSEAVAPARP